jgi:predicted dehydrogenase
MSKEWSELTDKIGVGIIGAGTISGFHARGYIRDERSRVVAICDIEEERAVEKAKKYNVPKWYTNLNELLQDKEIDAVDVCLPPALHAQVAVAALNAGKHVFVEKPMALTLKDCDDMINAARANNVKLMVGHNQLFFPPHNEAKRLVESEIGKPLVLVSRLHNGLPVAGWRTDPKISGGFITEACIHRLYVSRYLMGEVKRLSCITGKTSTDLPGEDMVIISMEFEKGSFGSISANSGGTYPLWDDRTEVIGSDGLVIVNGVEDQILPGPPLLFFKDGQWKVYRARRIHEEIKEELGEMADQLAFTSTEIETEFGKTFVYEVQHFVDCIVNDRTPIVSGEEGKNILKIIKACYESAEKGTVVNV